MTKQFARYESYKDSGAEWLGQIPAHWEIKKLKYLTSFINRGITPNYTEYSEYKVVNQATFSKGFLDIDAMRFHNNKNMSNTRRGIVNENDLLIASTGGGVLGKVAYINIQVNNFVADSHVTIIRNNDLQSNKFLYYFYSVNFDLINAVLAQGSTNQTELQRDWLINMFLPSPPLEEQQRIADFLDKKTAQIDEAITQKEKMIELLKEYRQVTINNAVTKGLDPNVQLKDSGIEWLGQIPAHWQVKKLKNICEINRNSLPENTNANFKIDYVDIGSVTFENGINKIEEFIFKTSPSRARRLAKTDDIIISTVRTYLKAIDLIDEIKSKYVYSTGFAILSPMRLLIHSKFLYNFVKSDFLTGQVTLNSKGMSYPAINSTDLSNLLVILPTLEEQKQIADFLDKKTVQIDAAIALKQSEIEKLKEYKATLIDSAVTGKIKINL